MEQYAYYNGKVGKWSEITIPLSDRSIFFADSVYDAAIGTSRSGIYLGKRHVERLFYSARAIGIKPEYTEEELLKLLEDFAERSKIPSYFIYFQLSASADERRHSPRDERTNLLIVIKEHTLPFRELKLVSFPDRRHTMCHIKSTNLLGSVLASEASFGASADEAVLLRGEYVTECAHSNIFIIKDEVLLTHPRNEYILGGIMRERLINASHSIGLSVSERPFSYSEIFSADDVIVSSTTRLAERAINLDGMTISTGNREIGDRLIGILRREYELFCSN